MKKIPKVLATEIQRAMKAGQVPREEQVRWFTWLRFYLDFCWKYGHATRDPEILPLWNLNSNGKTSLIFEAGWLPWHH